MDQHNRQGGGSRSQKPLRKIIQAEKVRLFVAALLRHDFSATKAMEELGQKPRAAIQRGYEMMKRPDVQKAIAYAVHKRQERLNLTADDVIRRLNAESLTADKSADRIRATELIGKSLKMFTDKVEVSGGLTLGQLVPKRIPRPANLDDKGNPT